MARKQGKKRKETKGEKVGIEERRKRRKIKKDS